MGERPTRNAGDDGGRSGAMARRVGWQLGGRYVLEGSRPARWSPRQPPHLEPAMQFGLAAATDSKCQPTRFVLDPCAGNALRQRPRIGLPRPRPIDDVMAIRSKTIRNRDLAAGDTLGPLGSGLAGFWTRAYHDQSYGQQ
jgi:hypothetical protein